MIEALCALHVGFLVRPWHRNINTALRKGPKVERECFTRSTPAVVPARALLSQLR
jgi:hypothetical protein